MLRDIQDEILRLKIENDICILAHSYQSEAVCEVADFIGDSFALARKAQTVSKSTVLMCGVRFMAEGVKLLCPDKKVILSHSEAGCPMAEQFEKELVLAFKEKNPTYKVVAYINTTAELKTVCDICVTSSSAVKIVKNMPEKDILFIPDCNLAQYVADMVPEKNIVYWNGGCPKHAAVEKYDVVRAKSLHPNAEVLVHPECRPEVVSMADYVGSTSGIMDYAIASDKKEFIIGTELAILEHLQIQCPDKKFYPLTKNLICQNMKLTTITDVLECVKGNGEVIELDEETMRLAKIPVERMIEMG